jgi:hypothetical protein
MGDSALQTHIKALGILQIVYAGAGLLLAFGMLAFFGGLATLIGFAADGGDRFIGASLMAAIGTLAAGFIVILSLPRLFAGIGLLKRRSWARILTIIVSAVGLFDVPFGLLLGIYGLWVTLNREGAAILEEQVQAV